MLPRLVALGYATRCDVAQARRPDKQVYRLTQRGERALRAWLEDTEPKTTDALILKVFFGDLVPAEVVAAHVRRHREEARAQLAEYREIERRIAGSPDDYHGYVTLRYGIARTRATIRWADEVLRELDARAAVAR